MSREERNALLHVSPLRHAENQSPNQHLQEGTGAAVMSAFVEIIFDNSDDRFPTGKPELVLRRTIGMKKDEYSLDRKNATKTDVMNLLESAGFSRSNPYYIVPQGRVTALTNMKDAERLTLLKEVAGTQVYETRRAESLKIMQETTNKRDKIDELLDYIKERLAELEEEKEELRDYQEKDKERRCLQYTLDYREQVAIGNELDNIDEQRQTGAENTEGHEAQFVEGEEELARLDGQMGELKQQVEFLKVDKRQLEDERKETLRAKAQVELEFKSLTEGQTAAQQAQSHHDAELRRIDGAIKEHEQQLSQLAPRYDAKSTEESRVKGQMESAESTRRRLFEKQGRNAQFRNKNERDGHLREQINSEYPSLAKYNAVRIQISEEVDTLEKGVTNTQAEIDGIHEQLERRGGSNDAIQKEIDIIKGDENKLIDERKILWREEAKLTSVISKAEEELRRAEQELSHTMDRNISRGLASVRRIRRQHNIEGAYGTLAELMDVNDRYRQAVEASAGQSLFHYVVDNDETATRLIDFLNKEKGGRLTFVPLSQLRPKVGNMPNASDALPMIEKIEFDRIYEKAFQGVFGNTVICPNLTIAGQYARSHGVKGVTLAGDQSDNKGAFTGGSLDNKHSRLLAVRNVSKWRDECETHRTRFTEIRRDLERKDQEITQAKGGLRKIEQQQHQQENRYGPLRQDLSSKMRDLERKQDDLDSARRRKINSDANFRSLQERLDALEAEISSPFKKELTPEEESQLETLSTTVQDLKRQHVSLSSERSDLESQKTVLEIELRENLRPRLNNLKTQDIESSSGLSSRHSLKQSQTELKRHEKSLQATELKLNQTDTGIEQATNTVATLQIQHADILTAQSEIARQIERAQKHAEKSIQKRRILTQRAAEVTQRIRELGILPSGAMEKFEKVKSEQVGKRLHKVNDALKKYAHVNKKAFEQYQNFTTQRDTLTKRREELDSSQASIEELIQVLDQRKDEAIERTFKQVSREFANVFERLVPAGRGRLVIQRRADHAAAPPPDEESDEDDDAGGRRSSVENYTGVGISVSFNSKHDDQQRIQQLSGGQKSTYLSHIQSTCGSSSHHLSSSSLMIKGKLSQHLSASSPIVIPPPPLLSPLSTNQTRSSQTITPSQRPSYTPDISAR